MRCSGRLTQWRRGAPQSLRRHGPLSGAALSAYVADQREPSDGDGGDGNSAVPKSRPNTPDIPNMVRAAAPHKAARGSLAEDNWQIPECRSETRSQRTSPHPRGEVPPARRKTLQERARSPPMPTLSCAASCQGIRRYAPDLGPASLLQMGRLWREFSPFRSQSYVVGIGR